MELRGGGGLGSEGNYYGLSRYWVHMLKVEVCAYHHTLISTMMTKILRNAHGIAVGVVPGKKAPYKRDKFPHTTAMRMDSPPTIWTIDCTEEDKIGIRLSYLRKTSTEYLFPHGGSIKEGQRLVTGPGRDSNHPNRYFLLTKLSSGGFYISSHVDPTLYVGISDDGYLSFVKEPYPWFLTSN
jgi:hypothetical protein